MCISYVIILMKAKLSTKQKKVAVRESAGKVNMSATAFGLTSQAGLIPVVKFLKRIGFEQTINQTVPHQRGARLGGGPQGHLPSLAAHDGPGDARRCGLAEGPGVHRGAKRMVGPRGDRFGRDHAGHGRPAVGRLRPPASRRL